MQSKARSHKEARINLAIGYTINYTANILLLPYLWIPEHPYLSGHIIGVVFTIISYARQFIIRRYMAKGD